MIRRYDPIPTPLNSDYAPVFDINHSSFPRILFLPAELHGEGLPEGLDGGGKKTYT